MSAATAESVLRHAERADLLRVSTAGSVDDGKSTLIGRLLMEANAIYEDQLAAAARASKSLTRQGLELAFFTDGLKDEREQGITIDVAYRYLSTPRRRFIIADTPGHEQYTRNMVTGASTADLAIILVDASTGLQPQSRRHAFIASLLRVQHVIVAINKMDLVDFREEVYERVRQEFADFAAKLEIPGMTFIPISALHGDNIVAPSAKTPWYGGAALLPFMETVALGGTRNLIDLRLPVQLVLRPTSSFRGYAGQLASGVIRVGEEVLALPSNRVARVESIHVGTEAVRYAFAPQSVAVTLSENIDLGRGGMLVHPRNVPMRARELDTRLVWMQSEAMRPGRTYLLKHATGQVKGVFTRLHYRIDPGTLHRGPGAGLGLNDIGRATLSLQRELLCDDYTRNRHTGAFIVIDPESNLTVGAGTISPTVGAADAELPVTMSSGVGATTVPAPGAVEGSVAGRLNGRVLWFTGLSGSGKTTIARALAARLRPAGQPVIIIDGDEFRAGLSSDLGFSREDRAENIRRLAEIAKAVSRSECLVVVAAIAPYEAERDRATAIIGKETVQWIHADAPLAVCRQRDPKGLYRQVDAGKVQNFTGIADAYEAPAAPALRIATDRTTLAAAVDQVLALVGWHEPG